MKIYIAKGYNSYTNKSIAMAFKSECDAKDFIEGLTDPKIEVISFNCTVGLVNILLKGV